VNYTNFNTPPSLNRTQPANQHPLTKILKLPVMAQGAVKPKPKPSAKTSHASRAGITKKGGRTVAPKKLNLIKAQKMTKKISGGLTAQTEKMLGARAGHLEMLGQGGKKKRSVGSGGGDMKGAKAGKEKK
jgi:hypothetical protein